MLGGAKGLETARVLFAGRSSFVAGAASLSTLPPPDLPEVAFAGRSNVGKSSLINALAGRRSLARASNAPGRTREVNFFDLGGALRLVDLPGFGFAKAPKTQRRGFQNLARAYLAERPNLKRVFFLIDARHGLKSTDEDAMTALDAAAVSYQGVLTKADKLAAGALEAVAARVHAALAKRSAAFPGLIATSAVDGTGIAELRLAIAAACGLAQ
ncbi:MAG: ribosome biogenesis GTP-binding protein YihA/YsxC [Caulobacteraceae bacterium]